MSDIMLWDILWKMVSILALVLVCYRPLCHGYRRLSHRLAYGVWPPKTREELENEEESRRVLHKIKEDYDYHPGSAIYLSDRDKERSERMLEAGKSFDDS